VLVEIGLERARQVTREGHTLEHDDSHTFGELSAAAACYADHASAQIANPATQHVPGLDWPWEEEAWKPKDPRRNLLIAAALIVAEIQRLDRLAKPAGPLGLLSEPSPGLEAESAARFGKACAEAEEKFLRQILGIPVVIDPSAQGMELRDPTTGETLVRAVLETDSGAAP
jgi:hypothetical protein